MKELERDHQEIEAIIDSLKQKPGALLPILHAIQDRIGFMPPESVPTIAEALNLSRAEVHGAISFYHDFKTTPQPARVIKLCRAEACQALGCESVVDELARKAWRGDRELELTKTEFDLLAYLARNAGIVCSHHAIYEAIWEYDFGPDSKALAVYIGYLRRKTEQAGETRLIQTVRGMGYVLEAPEDGE